jgi:hypothetical protein
LGQYGNVGTKAGNGAAGDNSSYWFNGGTFKYTGSSSTVTISALITLEYTYVEAYGQCDQSNSAGGQAELNYTIGIRDVTTGAISSVSTVLLGTGSQSCNGNTVLSFGVSVGPVNGNQVWGEFLSGYSMTSGHQYKIWAGVGCGAQAWVKTSDLYTYANNDCTEEPNGNIIVSGVSYT